MIFRRSLLTGLLIAFVLSGCAFDRITQKSDSSSYTVRTSDGWELPLTRFEPSKKSSKQSALLLVASPHTNAAFWSLEPSVDFAHYFAGKGYDVWAFSFRGAVRSHGRKKATYDDYVEKDLPAVVSFVRSKTEGAPLSVIGHSFGASIVLSSLARSKEVSFDQMVLLSPPFKYILPLPDCFYPPLRESLFGSIFFSKEMIAPEVESRYAIFADEPTPQALKKILSRVVQTGEIDRGVSWPNIPILFVSGKKDNLAPTEGVLALYESATTSEKTFREFGRSNFYAIDYDHHDLVLSRYAKAEVYPFIFDWLEKKRPQTL